MGYRTFACQRISEYSYNISRTTGIGRPPRYFDAPSNEDQAGAECSDSAKGTVACRRRGRWHYSLPAGATNKGKALYRGRSTSDSASGLHVALALQVRLPSLRRSARGPAPYCGSRDVRPAHRVGEASATQPSRRRSARVATLMMFCVRTTHATAAGSTRPASSPKPMRT